MKPNSYESAGVNIEKGDAFASFIASFKSPAVSKGIGGFAGGVEIDLKKYSNPILLSATDGVGTKLLIAQNLKKFDTLGIDLVAMCVNDLIVCGAEPISFLDYIATGKIEETLLQELITGVIKGCELAQCTLSGGETAEMPDVYQEGDFDLAGFASGIVEKSALLPKKNNMGAGDPIYGIPSSGIHSNGLSLARKIIPPDDKKNYSQLLIPTRIYTTEVFQLIRNHGINGAAHITGGGLEGNFLRILPESLKPNFTWDWDIPEIFTEIRDQSSITEPEMRKVFNMGIGIAFTLPKENEPALVQAIKNDPLLSDIIKIGELLHG